MRSGQSNSDLCPSLGRSGATACDRGAPRARECRQQEERGSPCGAQERSTRVSWEFGEAMAVLGCRSVGPPSESGRVSPPCPRGCPCMRPFESLTANADSVGLTGAVDPPGGSMGGRQSVAPVGNGSPSRQKKALCRRADRALARRAAVGAWPVRPPLARPLPRWGDRASELVLFRQSGRIGAHLGGS